MPSTPAYATDILFAVEKLERTVGEFDKKLEALHDQVEDVKNSLIRTLHEKINEMVEVSKEVRGETQQALLNQQSCKTAVEKLNPLYERMLRFNELHAASQKPCDSLLSYVRSERDVSFKESLGTPSPETTRMGRSLSS